MIIIHAHSTDIDRDWFSYLMRTWPYIRAMRIKCSKIVNWNVYDKIEYKNLFKHGFKKKVSEKLSSDSQ